MGFNYSREKGMVLAVCLIILFVVTLLVSASTENYFLNQKMTAAIQAQIIAFNSAEAGLIAAEAKINGKNIDLSSLKGKISYQIISDNIDHCQQHIFELAAEAVYQNAAVKLSSAYLQARQPPLPGCAISSYRLWWRY